jgi:hypothetical protein
LEDRGALDELFKSAGRNLVFGDTVIFDQQLSFQTNRLSAQAGAAL